MPENISLITALGGGLLSFLSPCVLPLVPVYLANLYGPKVFEAGGPRVPLFLHSLNFVVGFAVVYTLLGAIAGLTGYAVNLDYAVLNRIAGVLLIAFGLFLLVALKVPRLNFERRLAPVPGRATGYLRSFLIGAVFSVTWVACVGPILGGILALAAAQATASQGAVLLAAYSFGLGVPFLVVGFAFDTVRPLLRRIQRHALLVQLVSAMLLIGVGVLAVTNKLLWFASLGG